MIIKQNDNYLYHSIQILLYFKNSLYQIKSNIVISSNIIQYPKFMNSKYNNHVIRCKEFNK